MQRSPVTTKDLPRTPPALSQRLRGLPRGPSRVPRGPWRTIRDWLNRCRGPPWDPARVPGTLEDSPKDPQGAPGPTENVPGPPKTLPKDLRREPRGPLKPVQSVPYPGPETQAVGTLIALSPFALVLFCFASCSLFRTRTPFSLCCNQQTSFKARCPMKI